jgi:putative membrane protein
VILSDHGQTMGATFLQRYGYDLEELVRTSVSPGTTVGGPSTYAETGDGAGVAKGQSDWEHVSTVDVAAQESGAAKGRIGGMLRKRLHAGDPVPTSMTDLVVMASGNLGIVSFTGPKHRVTLEEIDRDQPELIGKLVDHPGVGFVIVATADGAGGGIDTVAVGKNGRHYMSDGRVVGEDPLLPYGQNAARHIKRTTSFGNCPDLLVMSTYWPDTNENAAFEELVGNHGGLGGEQTRPFVLFPSEWELDDTELIGAESVFRNLKRWTAITA